MNKKKRIAAFAAGGTVGLILAVVAVLLIRHRQLISKIPAIPESVLLTETVREQMEEARSQAFRKPTAGHLGMLGMVYHSSANYEQAARCYQLAVQRDRSQWVWDYYLGYLNMEMGNTGEVIENFKRVEAKNPDVDHAWYYMGSAYKNMGEHELALKSFGKIAVPKPEIPPVKGTTRQDHFPLSAHARYELARIYFDTGRMDLAEKTLKEIVSDNPTFGPAYRLLGNLYRVQGDLPQTSRYGARANDLVAYSPPVDTMVDNLVLLSRSELYLLKKIDEAQRSIYDQWALRLVNHAIQYMPENQYVVSKAINIYVWLNLDQQATALIDRHMGFYGESSSEMEKMGILFFVNGLYPQSIRYFSRALEIKPGDVEIQKKLAICYYSTGEKQRSLEMLDALLVNHPGDPEILADVAELLYFNLRESEKAIGLLSRLTRLDPSNPKLLKMRAGIAEKNGQIREAIALYESSFRGDPEDLTTIRFLGNLLTEQEMWGKCISHYQSALEFHPNDPTFLERLGTLLVACPDPALRDVEEGREYLERAFIHMYSRPNTLISSGRGLAYAYAVLGEKEKAIDIIRQTIYIGRQENISPSYQKELEDLYETFQNMGN